MDGTRKDLKSFALTGVRVRIPPRAPPPLPNEVGAQVCTFLKQFYRIDPLGETLEDR